MVKDLKKEKVRDITKVKGLVKNRRKSSSQPNHKKKFKKGKAGGPGRPKMTDDEKALNKLNRNHVRRLIARYVSKPRGELIDIRQDKKTPGLDMMIIGVILKGITRGEENKIDWVCDVMFGKEKLPTQEIDITSGGKELASVVYYLPKKNEYPK